MLFQVEMDVHVPAHLSADEFERIKQKERQYAETLQRQGKWRHLWRVAGRYANLSIFDVESPAELHDLLSALPLFPFMQIKVAALCRHASSIHDDDR